MVTYKIVRDDMPESPREWDNLGTLFTKSCCPSDFPIDCLSDAYRELALEIYPDLEVEHLNNCEEIYRNIAEKHFIILDVYAYIHSGTTISTSPFSCAWDSGQIGIIAARKGANNLSEERIKEILEGEDQDHGSVSPGRSLGLRRRGWGWRASGFVLGIL